MFIWPPVNAFSELKNKVTSLYYGTPKANFGRDLDDDDIYFQLERYVLQTKYLQTRLLQAEVQCRYLRKQSNGLELGFTVGRRGS